MLEIHQRSDENGYEKLLGGLDAEGGVKIIEAFDKGEVIGFGIFSYDGGALNLYKISAGGDLYLFDGIVRSALFKASLNGIEKAEVKSRAPEEIESYKKLNFISGDNFIIEPISQFMNGCKNCKNSC